LRHAVAEYPHNPAGVPRTGADGLSGCHPGARELPPKQAGPRHGSTGIFKGRLSDVTYRALMDDQNTSAARTLVLALTEELETLPSLQLRAVDSP
jgi:hypothetical protein